MLDTYRTPSQTSRIEILEKKSRFIGICRPLDSEAAAADFIAATRKAFPDASHHVYAWLLSGEQTLQRFSDAGEPSGTAGRPVLDLLLSQGIRQAGIVVVRYFGGTLLGSGGLTRAYGKVAALALEAAEPVTMRLCEDFRITVPYADVDVVRRGLAGSGAVLLESRFSLDAELLACVPCGQGQRLCETCADLTRGAALIEPAGKGYRPLPPPDSPPASHTA